MDEYRIFGPPGTGKTTSLATKYIPDAIEKFGPEKVMVVSFTRTAAMKIARQKSIKTGQRIALPPENVGTLHSICYHALAQPTIVETDKNLIQEWNSQNPRYTIYQYKTATLDLMGESASSNDGDQLLANVNNLRNRLATIFPMKDTDLIELCIDTIPYAPMQPDVIFVDEAQDMTKLQLKLIRNWALECKWIILVGDDDQCIFSFTGATPDAFLYPPVDDKKKTILRQSYRVPQEILTRANKLIKKVNHRESKEYLARQYNGQTVQGACKTIKSTWKEPDGIVTMALKYLDKDKSIMFLASCAYMLTNLKEQLKQNGVPFHNPYRVSRGDWNPLQSSGSGVSAREILLDFLSNGIDPNWWNINQFVTWAQFVKTGPTGLVHGRGRPGIAALKKAIEKNEPGLHTAENVAPQLLTPIALQHAKAHDVQWLYDNLKSQRQETFEYPKRIYNMYGKKKIEQTPKAIIGTIHSVKGEDADIVFLFPDISWQAHTQMEKSEENCEAVYRVFYVGMTRAREELIICTPATKKPSTNYEPLKSKRLKQPMLYVEI
jgi:DNA helicase-2/ATP-dependent DNA helicase PcrA